MAPHPTESSSGLPSGRGAAVQAERRRGWGALAVLAPHVLLGTWLLLVPDRLAFTASQLVVLAHVAVGLLTLPLFGYWLWAHARRRGEKRRRARETAVSIAVRRLVAATAIAGFATGLYVAWSGRVGGFSAVHGWLGVAVALPLALHLALERRRLAASLVLLAFAAGLGGSLAAVKTLPPKPERVPPPPFDYRMRPVGMYEP